MEEGVHQILNVNYYTHFWGNIFIAPFVLLFFVSFCITAARIFERKRPFIRWHFYVSFLLIPCAFIAVYWDVYKTGQMATALCQDKAGIHVYKTVEVDGFLGATDIERYSRLGFSYLEYGTFSGEKWRYTMKEGKAIRTDVEELISDYEVKRLKYDEKITKRIHFNKDYVANRHTGEIHGEDITIFIYPGWAESLFYGLTGFNSSPWICSDRSKDRRYSDTIDLHTLIPKK